MNDKVFMKEAINEAKKSQEKGNLPFGAVIVRKDKITSRGENKEFSENNVTAHAEMEALRKANKKLGRDLSGCIIYCSSEPCNMCASAIFQAKISKIVIGTSRDDLPHVFRQRDLRIHHLIKDNDYEPEVVWGILKEDSKKLFSNIKLR